MSKLSREEFESILEEAYIEGYNTALEDIQEDILDEEAFDLEGDYKVYTEKVREDARSEANKKLKEYSKKDDPRRKTLARLLAIRYSDRDYPKAQKYTSGKIEKDYNGHVSDREKK